MYLIQITIVLSLFSKSHLSKKSYNLGIQQRTLEQYLFTWHLAFGYGCLLALLLKYRKTNPVTRFKLLLLTDYPFFSDKENSCCLIRRVVSFKPNTNSEMIEKKSDFG